MKTGALEPLADISLQDASLLYKIGTTNHTHSTGEISGFGTYIETATSVATVTELNNLIGTKYTTFVSNTVNNDPVVSDGSNCFNLSLFTRDPKYGFQVFGAPQLHDQLFFRRNADGWQPWQTFASQEWVSENYITVGGGNAGTITGVAGNNGLTGSGTSGSVTLGLDSFSAATIGYMPTKNAAGTGLTWISVPTGGGGGGDGTVTSITSTDGSITITTPTTTTPNLSVNYMSGNITTVSLDSGLLLKQKSSATTDTYKNVAQFDNNYFEYVTPVNPNTTPTVTIKKKLLGNYVGDIWSFVNEVATLNINILYYTTDCVYTDSNTYSGKIHVCAEIEDDSKLSSTKYEWILTCARTDTSTATYDLLSPPTLPPNTKLWIEVKTDTVHPDWGFVDIRFNNFNYNVTVCNTINHADYDKLMSCVYNITPTSIPYIPIRIILPNLTTYANQSSYTNKSFNLQIYDDGDASQAIIFTEDGNGVLGMCGAVGASNTTCSSLVGINTDSIIMSTDSGNSTLKAYGLYIDGVGDLKTNASLYYGCTITCLPCFSRAGSDFNNAMLRWKYYVSNGIGYPNDYTQLTTFGQNIKLT